MKKTIEVSINGYQGTENRGGYRGLHATDGGNFNVSNVNNMDAVSFIDYVLRNYVSDAISGDKEPADITVELPDGITLSDNLKAHISDKFVADPVISSVTFA